MRHQPETIRAFLLRTTALYSRNVPLPACVYGIEATITMADGSKGTMIVPHEEAGLSS